VFLAGVVMSGCRTSEQASLAKPPPAPTGSFTYPEPGSGTPAAYTPVPSSQGSVYAPQPIPITFSGTAPASPGKPNITAKAAFLVDGSGRVLFEKNADAKLPTASTQKLLLGILVAEKGNLNGTLTVAESDTWAEPTIMGIKPGETYTRHELLTAVLVRSCNDIARALARDHSGSESAFAAAMNQRARQIGMENSYFTNSNGLPSPAGQYSTARDLAKLCAVALRNPVVRQAIGTKYTVFRSPSGSTKTLYNTNLVLKNFPYCTGAKTGYTSAAGRCLVSSASANGRSVIAVVLGSTSPTVWEESEALLRYGLGM
jgi:D-alanyl-D-alanine carboxypeptidase (penicillin-binding protein 5/6)